ncbi:MAG: metallophosphoesterase [Actinomycetota bacterium]
MSLATQTLLWAVVVGIAAAWVGVGLVQGDLDRRRLVPVGLAGVVTLLWLSRLGFFGVAHVVYLLATVVPACVLVGVLAVPAGRARVRTRGGGAVAVVLALPALLGLYASHVEPFWLRVDRVDVATDAGEGLRIGVLADLQTPEVGAYERGAVAELLASEPDLILIPGDLWQMSDEQIVDDWPIFSDLVAQMVDAVGHVVIVEGDTDHIGWLDRIGERTGALVAHDRVARLDVAGTTVFVGGTQLLPGAPTTPSAVALAELAAAESDEVLTIAVSHRPDVVTWLPGAVDLVVAGHTHGGQIQIPFFGPPVTFSDVPRSVAAGGLHEIDGQTIYVSTGVGRERKDAPQIRFNARPSIGVLDLVDG